jgi:hypothetical protein
LYSKKTNPAAILANFTQSLVFYAFNHNNLAALEMLFAVFFSFETESPPQRLNGL